MQAVKTSVTTNLRDKRISKRSLTRFMRLNPQIAQKSVEENKQTSSKISKKYTLIDQ